MTLDTKRWNAAESITDEGTARVFLEGVAADGDPEEIAHFIKVVAEGLGMIQLARGSGMSRDDLDDLVTPYNDQFDGEALRKAALRLAKFLPASKASDAA